MKLYVLSALALPLFIFGQISPPGLGDGNYANWYAIGVRQNLDADKKVESMTYFGMGLKSNDHEKFDLKPAIIVVNQEIYHKLNEHLKVSYALSYRNQKDYNITDHVEVISRQQEMRIYARASYSTKINKLKLTHTFRQEARKFMDQKWQNTDEPFQLRSRLKTQIAIPLDSDNHHTLTAGAEMLFSTSKNNFTKKWSKLNYKESRFTLFYTFRPKDLPIAISAGYMNNLIEKNSTHSVHYASLDVVLEDPFRLLSKKNSSK